jgi:hypothetical protein
VITEVWPDVEGAMRTWLRNHTAVSAIVGARVFFGVPKKSPRFPLVTVQRVGGGDDLGTDAPLDIALLQIDCWGEIDDSGNGVKSGATALVNAVRTALRAVGSDTLLTTGVTAHGVNVESVLWLPDPDNDRPRYSVTAEVTAIST